MTIVYQTRTAIATAKEFSSAVRLPQPIELQDLLLKLQKSRKVPPTFGLSRLVVVSHADCYHSCATTQLLNENNKQELQKLGHSLNFR